jgi:tRNA(Ile)-lysidine synthetase-like protein
MDLVSGALGELPEEARLLAAVSGGADSTAMLAACASVRGRAFCERGVLSVVHVDHGLRPPEECAGDAEVVRSLCDRLGVACTVAVIGRGKIEAWARDTGSGIEAAARHFRHEALRREAARVQADFILVAHTQDDALETAVMRFLRGSGPRGLALMPRFAPGAGGFSTQEDGGQGQTRLDYVGANPQGGPEFAKTKNQLNGADGQLCCRPLGFHAGALRGPTPVEGVVEARRAGTRGRPGNLLPPPQGDCNLLPPPLDDCNLSHSPLIFRPLRDVTRAEVLGFLTERGISYRTDSTNADVRYLRNRIRRCLVPVLDENFAEWRKGVLETAETQGLAADFIEDELEKRVRIRDEAVSADGSGEKSGVVIENLDELPDILREEALFAAFDRIKGDERTVRRRVVRDFARDSRVKAADAGDGVRLRRCGLPVRVARDEAFYEKGCSLLIKDAGEYTMNGLIIQAAHGDGGLIVHIKGKHNG